MALVESLSLELGQVMPDFVLSDPNQASHHRDKLMGENGLIIAFTCNHCPYAIAIWPRLIALSKTAQDQGFGTCAINPNIHPNYPDDQPDQMAKKIQEWQIPFPYLIDETQSIASAYQAQCTPDLYVINTKAELCYHGRLDDHWQDEAHVQQEDLKLALDDLSQGKPVSRTQYPSMGCSIKWQ